MVNVAIMGHGVVGSGVAEILIHHKERIDNSVKDDVNVKYILDLRDFENLSYSDKFVKDFNIILNDGCCPIHAAITKVQLLEQKEQHPNAPILIHPECEPELIAISDFIGSTAELIDYAAKSPLDEFILCTEDGVDYKLITDNPGKKFFYPTPHPCCADMKLNTLENILSVLEKEDNEVFVDEVVAKEAWKPLNRMLELGR